MLSCEEIVRRLETYLDRELSDKEVKWVRWHLAACPECEDHYKFEEKLRRLVRVHASNERAPQCLRDRVWNLFRQGR